MINGFEVVYITANFECDYEGWKVVTTKLTEVWY